MSFIPQNSIDYAPYDPSANEVASCFFKTDPLDKGISTFTNFSNDPSGNEIIGGGGFLFENYNSGLAVPLPIAEISRTGKIIAQDSLDSVIGKVNLLDATGVDTYKFLLENTDTGNFSIKYGILEDPCVGIASTGQITMPNITQTYPDIGQPTAVSTIDYVNQAVSGATSSAWSQYPATQNVDLAEYNIFTSDGNNTNTITPSTITIVDLAGNTIVMNNVDKDIYIEDASGNGSGLSPTYNSIFDAVGNNINTTPTQIVLTTPDTITTISAPSILLENSNPSVVPQIVLTDNTTGYNSNLQFNQFLMNGMDSVFTAQSSNLVIANSANTRIIVQDITEKQIYIADEDGFGSYMKSTENSMYDSDNNTIKITATKIVSELIDGITKITIDNVPNTITIEDGTSTNTLTSTSSNITDASGNQSLITSEVIQLTSPNDYGNEITSSYIQLSSSNPAVNPNFICIDASGNSSTISPIQIIITDSASSGNSSYAYDSISINGSAGAFSATTTNLRIENGSTNITLDNVASSVSVADGTYTNVMSALGNLSPYVDGIDASITYLTALNTPTTFFITTGGGIFYINEALPVGTIYTIVNTDPSNSVSVGCSTLFFPSSTTTLTLAPSSTLKLITYSSSGTTFYYVL